jgi:hypothetical protein
MGFLASGEAVRLDGTATMLTAALETESNCRFSRSSSKR